MTAQELARALAGASKIKGLVVLYETSRNQAARDGVSGRHAKQLRAATDASLHGDKTIEYISRMAVRTLNPDKSITMSETATHCRGQHVPAAKVAKLMKALGMPANGIELQLVQVGSAADIGAPAGRGAVVMDGTAKKRMKQQQDDEKQQRKEATEKRMADMKAELEQQIRKIAKGFRCPNCDVVYAVQQNYAKHVMKCMGGGDDATDGAAAPGGECLRDAASAAHTAASEQQQRGEDQRRRELGHITVTSQTADELQTKIGHTYPLVPTTATLIQQGSSDGKWWATFQRAAPAYWRGMSRPQGDREGFTPIVDMLLLLLPKYHEYKSNSGISMYRLRELLEDMAQLQGLGYLIPTLEQLDQWWKAENERNYKPLLAIGSHVVILDDATIKLVEQMYEAAARAKTGKKGKKSEAPPPPPPPPPPPSSSSSSSSSLLSVVVVAGLAQRIYFAVLAVLCRGHSC